MAETEDVKESPDEASAIAMVSKVAADNGGRIDTSFQFNMSSARSIAGLGAAVGIVPGLSTFSLGLNIGSILGALSTLVTTISFAGGSVFAIKFLREGRLLIEKLLEVKSHQKIIIESDGVWVELHGKSDIERALVVFHSLHADKRPLKGRQEDLPASSPKPKRRMRSVVRKS